MSNTFRGLAALPAVLALAILMAPLGSAAP